MNKPVLVIWLAMGLLLFHLSPSQAFDFSSIQPYRNWKPPREERVPRERADRSEQAEDPKQAKIRARQLDLCNQANAANERGDLREAIRLVREALAIQEDASLRNWLTDAEALFASNQAMEDGNAARKKGDIEQAIALFRQAMRYPSTDTPEMRLYIGDLEDRLKRQREGDAAQHEREEEERRNRPEAEQLNNDAVRLLKAGEPDAALAKLNKAYGLLPEDRKITSNWWIAKANIALREARLNEVIVDLESAINFDPGNQDAEAALERARAQRNEQRSQVQTAFAEIQKNVMSGPSADTLIVDARVAQLGSDLLAQVAELQLSPAADRVRKGYQAVMNHDWPVALAWWREALQRDPNNAALQRSTELAGWMVNRQKMIAARPPSPLDAAVNAVAKGDDASALLLIEKAKAANPALAVEADRMTTVIRARAEMYPATKSGAGSSANDGKAPTPEGMQQALSDSLFETGLNFLSVGDQQHADEMFREAVFFYMFDHGKPFLPTEPAGATPTPPDEERKLEFINN